MEQQLLEVALDAERKMVDIFQIGGGPCEKSSASMRMYIGLQRRRELRFDVAVFEVELGEDAEQQTANLALRQARQHDVKAWIGIAQPWNRSAPRTQQHEHSRATL